MSFGGYEDACGEDDRRQIVRWLGGFLQGCSSISSEDRRMLRSPMKEILRCYTVIHTPVQHPFSHKHPASGQSAGLLRNPQLGNPPLTAAL